MPRSLHFDAVVLGAGQAGPPLAARLAAEGHSVALVERRHLGGTCVNDGCIPTKALVASARVAHQVRRAAEYGVDTGPVSVDMGRIHRRMRSIVEDSRTGLGEWLEGTEGLTLVRGHGRFEAPLRLRVTGVGGDVPTVDGDAVHDDLLLEADRVFLDVGARPRIPDWDGLDAVDFLTSTTILELTEVPEHLVVVGGGPVGLELAQIFRRFGARVTVIEQRDRLMAREDADVCETLGEIFAAEDIAVRLSARCLSVETRNGAGTPRVAAHLDCAEGEPEVEGSHLLLAVGRVPNTDDLGVEAAGLELDERGYVVTDDHLATSVDGVWALGEVNGRGAFTHTAYDDFQVLAAHLLDGEERSVDHRHFVYGLYVDPPLGRVGPTLEQARADGHRVLVGKRSMDRVGRAKEKGETTGFLRVQVDADSEQILGAAIFGVGGDEVVHVLAAAMAAGTPAPVLARAVFAHPTVSELLPTVLQNLEPVEG